VKDQFPARALFSISENNSVAESFAEIGKRLVSGLAVVDSDGKLIGNISASDIKVI
jgi:CBS domain-containing protein